LLNKVKKLLKDKLKFKNPKIFFNNFIKKRNLQYNKQKYKQKYNANEILDKLIENGLRNGDTLFIHSSWEQFYNYTDTPRVLIDTLIDFLGENGTLAMPSFPQDQSGNKIFNLKKTPSAAGFLTEIFRRYKGVKRSINLNHSICAVGKNAEFLTNEHHKSLTSWDKYSPYYKLKEVDALIVGLGVGHNLEVATSLHCVESILKDEIYFYSLLFKDKIIYQYKDLSGNIGTHTYLQRNGKINTKKLSKYFSKEELCEFKFSNLDIYTIRAKILIDNSLELGKRGITMYVDPKPKKELFYRI